MSTARDYVPTAILGAALVANYVNHRAGRGTICSTSRPIVPVPVFVGALGWFVPHWLGPKLKGSTHVSR